MATNVTSKHYVSTNNHRSLFVKYKPQKPNHESLGNLFLKKNIRSLTLWILWKKILNPWLQTSSVNVAATLKANAPNADMYKTLLHYL
jgi:hypothetical protein